MALSSIDAVCTKCSHKFNQAPKQSFLGFQKLTCPACQEKITYPLTKGYRTTYWVIFALMVLMIINAFVEGDIGYPGGLGLAVAFALLRDRIIRKRIVEAIKSLNKLGEQPKVSHKLLTDTDASLALNSVKGKGAVMKSLGQKAIWVVAFIAVFVVVKYAKEGYVATNGIERANISFEKNKADAVATHPDMPPSIAFAEVASKNAEASLVSAGSLEKKRSVAADQFFGFYYVNVKARHEYCLKLGVDIAPFVKAFIATNAQEYRIASATEGWKNTNKEWFLSKMESVLRSTIDQAMLDAAKQQNTTPKGVCAFIAENGQDFATAMSFQKIQPASYAALRGI